MENKALLLEAIRNNLTYSKSQQELLKYFLVIEANDIVSTSPRELVAKFKITRQTIGIALKCFQNENLIKKLTPEKRHTYKFLLNQSNFQALLEEYLKKKNYIPEI